MTRIDTHFDALPNTSLRNIRRNLDRAIKVADPFAFGLRASMRGPLHAYVVELSKIAPTVSDCDSALASTLDRLARVERRAEGSAAPRR